MRNQKQLRSQELELSSHVASAKVVAIIGALVLEGVAMPLLVELYLVLLHLHLLLNLLHLVLNKAASVAKESCQ
jgi:hypothetical protein